MKQAIIALVLLFTGNMSVATTGVVLNPQTGHPFSRCQNVVYNMFHEYGLPFPGIGILPLGIYGSFNLQNLNSEKPEFTITTEPIEINKRSQYQELTNSRRTIILKDHLRFEGKVLNDGSYVLIISEIHPLYQKLGQHNFFIKDFSNTLRVEPPIVHTFHFSNNCEFNTYSIGKQAGVNTKGFYVAANSQCEFDEPHKVEFGLTAHILYPTSQSQPFRIIKISEYTILDYPNYYKNLCAIAKKH